MSTIPFDSADHVLFVQFSDAPNEVVKKDVGSKGKMEEVEGVVMAEVEVE